jgi:deazaflavin-dependent oxidoreductase (nitroreductase family)
MAPGTPTVVLHNRGAKTGKLRKTPLAYISDGDDVILTASKGGAAEHPAWLHNVKANPDVELWVGSRGGPYTAQVATAEEKARLWPLITQFYSGYDDYQRRAGKREIQVVICSPK